MLQVEKLEGLHVEEATQRGMVEQLDQVPLGRMYQASFKAVIRLQLFFTGMTHELFSHFTETAQAVILRKAGGDGILSSTEAYEAQSLIFGLWGDAFKQWSDAFYKARVEAASIPFGVLAVTHERLIVERQMSNVEEGIASWRNAPLAITEAVEDGVFSPQLSVLLNAASEHLYGDNLNLSARVWNVDREARDGIAQVILKGVSNQSSAWQIAQELEQFLGASADCPRWTSTRLYGRTKTEIAKGDTTGLVSRPCDGRGVSYNALRLSRTELQKAHALATDKIMAAQPWVEKEQVHLSEAHPEPDICDDVAHGGEGGKGIYSKGEHELPFHPNCLCYKTAVLMPEKEFTSRMRGWLNGEQSWSEMDDYAALVSGSRSQVSGDAVGASLLPNAINLAVWLFGNSDQLAGAL